MKLLQSADGLQCLRSVKYTAYIITGINYAHIKDSKNAIV